MNSIIASSFLVVAIFLQYFKAATAKQCSYSQYGDTNYYTCQNNKYCCGRGSCCYTNDYYYSVYDLWYFWFCLCFGIFVCSLASGAYYRKRQLNGVQVEAIHPPRIMHGHGAMTGPDGLIHPHPRNMHQHGHGAMPGPDGLMHPHPRNVMVTTTDASGQPVYPPQAHFDGQTPNYSLYGPGGPGGPIYPAYAYLPPPPSYSSLGTGVISPSSVTTSHTSSSPSSSSGVPQVSN